MLFVIDHLLTIIATENMPIDFVFLRTYQSFYC